MQPWSVPKQNALMLAVVEASTLKNTPQTLFGFLNISSDPLSFADILSAAETPRTSAQGRRRLLGSHAFSLPSALRPSGVVRSKEEACAGDSSRGQLTRRILQEPDVSSITVYLRLTTDYLDQTAEDFWDQLTGPLPGNSSEFSKP